MTNRRYIIRIAALTCLVVALTLAVRVHGQAPPAPAQDQAPTTAQALRVLTRLVQISVIANDGNGKPVTGLTKDDFKVFDQGQEQKINFFTEQSNQNLTLKASATAPAPDTFSNGFEQKANSPTSATVILLDSRNTHALDMAYARKQVGSFLSELQPQDRVALYLLGSKLTVLHDFTQDSASIMRALGTDKNTEDFRISASEAGTASSGDANMDAAVDAANGRAAEFYMNNRVEQTALAIKIIADHLKGLPGRKNLVWVSAAFPIQILTAEGPTPQAPERPGSGGGSGSVPGPIQGVNSYVDQIVDATRSLNSANVAVYPVDARGLIGNPLGVNKAGPRGTRAAMRPNTASPFPARENFDTMNTFAERTGGKAFYNTNDIHGAVRKALDDSQETYVLGYYPTNTNWDGKFREIKVRTDKPGLHLRYRLGYFAVPDEPATEEEKARLMQDAEWSPLESTDLALEVKADPMVTASGRQLQAQVRIASDQLHFEQNDNRWKDSLELVWVEIGPSGQSLGTIKKTVGLDVPQESYDLLVSKGIDFNETLKIRDDAIEVRLVIRDAGSGAIGSVIIPLNRVFAKTSVSAPKN